MAKCLYCHKEKAELIVPDKCTECRKAKYPKYNGKKWIYK